MGGCGWGIDIFLIFRKVKLPSILNQMVREKKNKKSLQLISNISQTDLPTFLIGCFFTTGISEQTIHENPTNSPWYTVKNSIQIFTKNIVQQNLPPPSGETFFQHLMLRLSHNRVGLTMNLYNEC